MQKILEECILLRKLFLNLFLPHFLKNGKLKNDAETQNTGATNTIQTCILYMFMQNNDHLVHIHVQPCWPKENIGDYLSPGTPPLYFIFSFFVFWVICPLSLAIKNGFPFKIINKKYVIFPIFFLFGHALYISYRQIYINKNTCTYMNLKNEKVLFKTVSKITSRSIPLWYHGFNNFWILTDHNKYIVLMWSHTCSPNFLKNPQNKNKLMWKKTNTMSTDLQQ